MPDTELRAVAPVDPFSPQNRRTVDRLTRIGAAIGARRYLEVGVLKGQTFLNLDFAEMHAVDPNFRFDPATEARPNRQFFSQTSDQFFAVPPDAKPYDLIFLDGLHTFAQTFRDLCASQVLSHAGTVVVIDDTVPSDMVSMIPDQRISNQMRKRHNLAGRNWHGDVCKVVMAIHDFFPNLDYRTIMGAGNPQTAVIRRPRADFKPRWNDLEAISRLDYAGFLANMDVMQPIDDGALVDWVSGG